MVTRSGRFDASGLAATAKSVTPAAIDDVTVKSTTAAFTGEVGKH